MKRYIRITLLLTLSLLLLGLCSAVLAADENAPKHLTHDQAFKDTKTFLSLLEATHPDPYTNLGVRSSSKGSGETGARSSREWFVGSRTYGATRGILGAPQRWAYAGPWERSRWQDSSPRLAVQFGITSDALVITSSDLQELKGTRGDKVVAVNGHTVPELMNRMLSELSTENEYGTYYGLTLALRSFNMLSNLIPDLDRSQGVRYTLEDANGNKVERTISGMAIIRRIRKSGPKRRAQWAGISHPDQPYYYSFLDDNRTAYFRVASMVPRESYEIMKGYHVVICRKCSMTITKRIRRRCPPIWMSAIQGVPSLTEPATQMCRGNEAAQHPEPDHRFTG